MTAVLRFPEEVPCTSPENPLPFVSHDRSAPHEYRFFRAGNLAPTVFKGAAFRPLPCHARAAAGYMGH